MLAEIDVFVNWLRRRNPDAKTWRDRFGPQAHTYRGDLKQFAEVVGDHPPGSVMFHDVDRFVMQRPEALHSLGGEE